MSLPKQLTRKKAVILKTWVEMVINTYPAETARFLNSQKDPFANPVGQTTQKNLETLFELLLDEHAGRDVAKAALDPIIRIRAIQDFTPAQATRFVFDLKNVLRNALSPERPERMDQSSRDDLTAIENRIDELGLLAFDIYMQCREKVYQIKANDLKDRTFKAFARAGLVKEP